MSDNYSIFKYAYLLCVIIFDSRKHCQPLKNANRIYLPERKKLLSEIDSHVTYFVQLLIENVATFCRDYPRTTLASLYFDYCLHRPVFPITPPKVSQLTHHHKKLPYKFVIALYW